jgi:hypothetical protein
MDLGPVNRLVTKAVLAYWLPRRAYTKAQFEALVAKTGFRSASVGQTPLALEVEMVK